MSILYSSTEKPASDEVNVLGNINPSVMYKIGFYIYFFGLGLNFTNMSVLSNAETYRTIIAFLLGTGFTLAFMTRGPARIQTDEYPYMKLMLNVWLFYSIYLTAITILRGSDIALTIYSGTPFYFMLLSMILAYRHIMAGYANSLFWTTLLFMAIQSTAINFYFARLTTVNYFESEFAFIEDIRYQIISSSSGIITTMALVNIMRSRQLILSYALLAAVMFIYVIAKTRGVLLGLTVLILYLVFMHTRRMRFLIRLSVIFFVSITVAYLVPLYTINFDIFEAWYNRIFTEDDSLSLFTLYTRLAEYKAQLNMLLTDVQSALFGFGYRQTMILDPYIWDQIAPDLDPTFYYMTRYVGAHSTWINSMFHGGFIFGLIPFITITSIVLIAIWQITLPRDERAKFDLYAIYPCALVCSAWLPANFAMMFGDRLGPAAFGPSLIYGVFAWEKYRNERRSAKYKVHTRTIDDRNLSGQLVP